MEALLFQKEPFDPVILAIVVLIKFDLGIVEKIQIRRIFKGAAVYRPGRRQLIPVLASDLAGTTCRAPIRIYHKGLLSLVFNHG